MLNKKNLVVATLATMAAVALVVTQTAESKQNQANKLEGAWVAKVPGMPVQWSYVLSPSDPSGRRAAISGSLHVRIPADILYPDLVPATDYSSDLVGEAMMTGPDTANFTSVGYGINKVDPPAPFYEQVVLIWVNSGQVKFTGPGKTEVTHHVAYYLPAADGDGDGLPDPGQTPFLCLPATSLDTRVGLMPPCPPPTP
ncbi:MAG: hypothetical protein HYY24_27790 [Verrucomicrobia bacterium]|nr:hypothetical protein [Verrucomicrobiota bacterium]